MWAALKASTTKTNPNQAHVKSATKYPHLCPSKHLSNIKGQTAIEN
jgi:hypothetical protein